MKLERIIGPLPGASEARAFGVAGIGVALIACALSLYYGFHDETFLGRPLGGDFVEFYAAGRVMNEHRPAMLFDPVSFSNVQHESLPTMPATQWLMLGNPPCIAAVFQPFALLAYKQAYCAWLVFSAALYSSGVFLLLRGRWDATRRRSAILLALSTPIFTLETWIGGQISIFAFFFFVLFVRCFEARRYFLAGLALGLTAYKPPLLAVPAAVFLFAGSWRLLAGVCITAGLELAACFAVAGTDGMALWLQTLKVFRYIATDEQSILRRTKYVDMNSFLVTLFGLNAFIKVVALILVAAALLRLAWIWFRFRGDARLLLAGTLAAGLILNVYVPVYDTITLIPALVLAATVLQGQRFERPLQIWILLFALVPWLTQASADFLRVQLLTILIAAFSYWVLRQNTSSRPSGQKDRS
jgi:hypothetical protein